MSHKYPISQWFYSTFKMALHRSSEQQKPRKKTPNEQHTTRLWMKKTLFPPTPLHPHTPTPKCFFRVLYATSVFFVLVATMTALPASKVLAENAPTQDLDAASFYQQGVMRYHRQDLQAAENAFRQALQRDPNLGTARNYLGNIMLQQNRLDIAVQEYTDAIRINPNLGEAYYNLGLALHKQGQNEAAITAYRQALVIDPTMASAQYNLGLALYEKGQKEEASTAYQQAINLDSSNANAFFNLAIALQEQGRLSEAIAAYRRSLQLNSNNAVAYNNIGSLQVIQGQASLAVATYVEAIRQIPNDAAAYHNLGVTLYNLGDFKKAKVVLKHARNHYRQQGNIEQAEIVDQLMQQIAQMQTQKDTQVGQASTPVQTQGNPTDVPAAVEQQPPLLQEMPSLPETPLKKPVNNVNFK